jgi:Cu2+-exporting ATPase
MAASAETGFLLEGLRCASCVRRTEQALRAVPGVEGATINYTDRRALVRFDPDATSVASLVGAVAALGYQAIPFDPEALERPAAQAREALVRLLVAFFLAANVMWLAIALYSGSYQDMDPATRRTLRWLVVALSFPSVTYCALPFWRGALAGLARREITIDLPIVLGFATAFVANVVGTLAETQHLFVDSAAMIVFLILLGRTLERRASARAASAVERLRALAPREVLRLVDGRVERVALESVAAGERVVVPAGQVVPLDGRLVGPAAELDESALTGEVTPVARAPGEAVAAGARNLLAEIELVVTAPASRGTLARLAALLERAQSERPQLQRLADRVAAVFAPAVLTLAGATALGWAASGASALDVALAATSVLIVACPCVFGLATPAAIAAALGRAASLGILVKSGEALERCASVDHVLLDKTGTLTEGRFALVAVRAVKGASEEEVIAAAAEAEGGASHPIADAIRRAAEERGLGLAIPDARVVLPGRGVVAGEGAERRAAGTRAHLAALGVASDAALEAEADALARGGASLVRVARGVRLLGVLALLDTPREDAAALVARLARDGVAIGLVSGDHEAAVRAAAERTGVRELRAGATPEAKVAEVRARQARGARVLAVGDGINDAAFLGAADVGVAMGRGSDVALAAADAVIRTPRVSAAADLVELSRACLARIRENLGFALAYNLVAVPLAAFGVLDPLPAAIAMSVSSLVVTGNSVRLLRWRART